jgi:hypothetical protein
MSTIETSKSKKYQKKIELLEVDSSKSEFCFWDKHEIIGEKIQCPISYKNKQVLKKKKEYQLNYGISRNAMINNENLKPLNYYIEYDDCFCSKECCLAWIYDNMRNPRYVESRQIFINEFISPEERETIKRAPHWRLLKKFGGFLSIEEFRDKNKIYEKEDVYFKNGSLIRKYKESKVCF